MAVQSLAQAYSDLAWVTLAWAGVVAVSLAVNWRRL